MIPIGVIVPFLVLVFVVNPLVKLLRRGPVRPWELVTVFSVSFTGIHINEILGRVLAIYAIMHYMATPENLWAEYAFNLVPPWFVVEDASHQLAWFYEGLPPDASVPWSIRVRPTF